MARDCCSFVRRQAQPAPRTAQEEGCTARKATSTHRRRCHGLAYKHLNRLAHGPASCGSVEHLQGAVPQSSRLLLNLCWVPAPPPGVENMDDTEPLPQRKRRSRKRDRPEASGAGGEDVDAAVAEAPAASQGQPDGRDAASTRINTTDHKEEDGPEELPLYRSAQVPGYKFEYLDHTADVQIHSWGENLEEAFEGAALGMFNYMIPLSTVDVDPKFTNMDVFVEGHDLHSLLFHFLDELLFLFCSEQIIAKQVNVESVCQGSKWTVECRISGEKFESDKHERGTEIKAITYSAMQVVQKEGDCEVFVIVDI